MVGLLDDNKLLEQDFGADLNVQCVHHCGAVGETLSHIQVAVIVSAAEISFECSVLSETTFKRHCRDLRVRRAVQEAACPSFISMPEVSFDCSALSTNHIHINVAIFVSDVPRVIVLLVVCWSFDTGARRFQSEKIFKVVMMAVQKRCCFPVFSWRHGTEDVCGCSETLQQTILNRLATSDWLHCGSFVRFWSGLSRCGVCAVSFLTDRASGKSIWSLAVASSTVPVGANVS